jgi:hypothetical protein
VLARSSNRLPSGQLRFTQARNLPALLDPTWSGFSSPLAAQFLFRVYDGARTPPEELVIPAFSLRSGDRTSKRQRTMTDKTYYLQILNKGAGAISKFNITEFRRTL